MTTHHRPTPDHAPRSPGPYSTRTARRPGARRRQREGERGMTTHRTPTPDHTPVFRGPGRSGPYSTHRDGTSRVLVVLGAGTGTAGERGLPIPSHGPPVPARPRRGSAEGGAA